MLRNGTGVDSLVFVNEVELAAADVVTTAAREDVTFLFCEESYMRVVGVVIASLKTGS